MYCQIGSVSSESGSREAEGVIRVSSTAIFAAFMARKCPVCGGYKREQSAFCTWCYRELPKALQLSLWKAFGEGFEEEYQASLSWLHTHPVKMRKSGEQPTLFKENV
jgi:hypothetical protein